MAASYVFNSHVGGARRKQVEKGLRARLPWSLIRSDVSLVETHNESSTSICSYAGPRQIIACVPKRT